MKYTILLFLHFFFPILGSTQPSLLLSNHKVIPEEAVDIKISVLDFTDITRVEFEMYWDGDLLEKPIIGNVSLGDANFEIDQDTLKGIINFEGENQTLADSIILVSVTFMARNDCDRASALKFSKERIAFRSVSNETIEVGFIPKEGYVKILCDTLVDLPGSSRSRNVCEGNNFQENSETGTYVDVFSIMDGKDSIQKVNISVVPFQNLSCAATDTFFIPKGYTHIVLPKIGSPNFVSSKKHLIVNPDACYSNIEITYPNIPFYDNNVYGVGRTDFVYTFDNGINRTQCTYTVNVVEQEIQENLLSFLLEDKTVKRGEEFCVDVTTKNFKELIGFTLKMGWDSTFLKFIEVKFPAIYEENLPSWNLKELNELIFVWLTKDFLNGYSLPDNTVIYSICFKAKKEGQIPINFYSKGGVDQPSTEIIGDPSNWGNRLDVPLKSGTITINEAAVNCGAVPTAQSDTFNTKENKQLIFDPITNDLLPMDINWQTSIISLPHIGTLTALSNGQFSYKPRFAYTGVTFFDYQICNEACIPEGCTSARVILNVEGQELGEVSKSVPIPTAPTFETSKAQPAIQAGELVIFNIYGQPIEKSYFLNNSKKQLWNLQQNELPAGIYFYAKRAKGTNKIIESGKFIAVGR